MGRGTDHYDGALLEEFRDQLKFITEALKALKDVPADLQQIKKDLAEMKQWRGITELVIKDQSRTLNTHETRITALETA